MKLGDKDITGRRKPVGTDKFETIKMDYIISTIGQSPDESIWDSGFIKTDH